MTYNPDVMQTTSVPAGNGNGGPPSPPIYANPNPNGGAGMGHDVPNPNPNPHGPQAPPTSTPLDLMNRAPPPGMTYHGHPLDYYSQSQSPHSFPTPGPQGVPGFVASNPMYQQYLAAHPGFNPQDVMSQYKDTLFSWLQQRPTWKSGAYDTKDELHQARHDWRQGFADAGQPPSAYPPQVQQGGPNTQFPLNPNPQGIAVGEQSPSAPAQTMPTDFLSMLFGGH